MECLWDDAVVLATDLPNKNKHCEDILQGKCKLLLHRSWGTPWGPGWGYSIGNIKFIFTV